MLLRNTLYMGVNFFKLPTHFNSIMQNIQVNKNMWDWNQPDKNRITVGISFNKIGERLIFSAHKFHKIDLLIDFNIEIYENNHISNFQITVISKCPTIAPV